MGYFSAIMSGLTGRCVDLEGAANSADCAIACSFGLRRDPSGRPEPGPANAALAALYVERFAGLPAVMQSQVYDALPIEVRARPTVIRVGGEGSGASGRYLSTHGVLVRAGQAMAANGWRRAVLIGHRYHMARIARTASKLGIDAAVASGMPATWDGASSQLWTRRPELWGIREVLVITRDAVQRPIGKSLT